WGMVETGGFALRAAVEGRYTGNVPANDARARFRAFTARADFCFATFAFGASAAFLPCVGVEGGEVLAEGIVAPPAVTSTKPAEAPWLAGLLSPRLRLTSERLFFEVVPELRLP